MRSVPLDTASSRQRSLRWRVVDIVTAAVIGVAAGLLFFVWNLVYAPLTAPLEVLLPGLQSLLYGVWLIAGILGALIIRKPGAALFTEVVAAFVSMTLGASWGLLTLESALVQGLGAEIVFLLVMYRRVNPAIALAAGAVSGLAMGVNDVALYYAGYDLSIQLIYIVSGTVSGALLAGLGGWMLVRALARTGALARFPVGREASDSH